MTLAVMAGLTGALLWLLPEIFDELADPTTNAFLPENTLPIMLIAGTTALLVGLAALVVVLAQLGLTSERYPLGLPEGSIRAVIALLLIVLFFISAMFLYADAGRGPTRELRGISAQRLAAIPTELIQDLRPNPAAPDQFDVVLVGARSTASTDIAKQLITTVSTLVVAVAAFYFGSSSVQTAQGTRGAKADGEERTTDGAAPPPTEPAGPAPPPTPRKAGRRSSTAD